MICFFSSTPSFDITDYVRVSFHSCSIAPIPCVSQLINKYINSRLLLLIYILLKIQIQNLHQFGVLTQEEIVIPNYICSSQALYIPMTGIDITFLNTF